MKFSFNFKYFTAGIIIVLIINYNSFFSSKTQTQTTNNTGNSTVTVTLGDIKNSIEVVGDAQLVDEQSLSFNQAGTITAVNFKAGDEVKKGDVIAEIDSSDAYNSIEEAKINLENAKLSLEQLYEQADESQILQAKNSIITAENNLAIAQKEFENLKVTQNNSLNEMLENIETSKKELESSKASLELSKKELEILIKEKANSFDSTQSNKSTTITNIEDNFKSNLVDIDKIIEQSDYILGVTEENRDKNDSYESFLSAKNTSYLSQAKSSLLEAISMQTEITKLLSNYDYSGDKQLILNLLEKYSQIFNKLYETTDYVYKAVDNSIESVGSLSQSEIDSMKNTMSSYRSTSLSKISSINSSINTLNTLTDTDLLSMSNENSIASKQESIKSSELQIEKQELSIKNSLNDYDSTVKSYQLAIESKTNDIESKKVSLQIAKLNLEELLEGPTQQNVNKANNTIKQAQIKLDSTYKSLDDYKLEAPFDGVVRKIDYMLGDNLTNDTDKYVYIENPNLLEITVMLDQIDIVSIKESDEASITFDAYLDTPVKAKISSIDTTPIQSSGVISYEVKLVLDDPSFDKKILSGFSADVEIITQSKTNVLLLKTSAIIQENGKYYVNLIKDGSQVKTEVEIGIASGGMTEIISGLSQGDNISLEQFVSTTTISTTTPSSTSLFGTPGGDRQGPPAGF